MCFERAARIGFVAPLCALLVACASDASGDADGDGADGGDVQAGASAAGNGASGSAAAAGSARAGSGGRGPTSGTGGGAAGGGSGRGGNGAGHGGAGNSGGSGGNGSGPIPPPSATVDDPNLVVLPWNGFAAAVSFTFDDADPTHYELAGPVLDERGIKATFFVVSNTIEGFGDQSREGFLALAEAGHEMGNHTVSHKGSSENDPAEVSGCDAYIAETFGHQPVTFAYPNVDVTATYKDPAAALYVASRGGGAGEHVTVDGEFDWHDVPSIFVAEPENDQGFTFSPDETMAALDETLAEGAWRILTIHGVGSGGFFANTDPASVAAIADHVAQDGEFWIDTFARVASYLRAQRALEAAAAAGVSVPRITWQWTLPPRFAADVRLRVLIDGGTLTQDGAAVPWDGVEGFYSVDPTKLELTWAR
jgi:peptidoglycan/xylan/chitin deacetylase (PgdA/CDA1 family)